MRALSWWVTWADLEIGNSGIHDDIERRADEMASAHADTAVIFGMHFRWDYLPYWDIVHSYIHDVAEALHARGLKLFDHHSCTLTHRYDTPGEVRNLMTRYMRHLPLVPSREAAATWQFNGHYLNDWRMIDARTGKAGRVPQYCAEEFCINNPDFRDGYKHYLKKLLSETAIDGLMCDDMIYFGGFYQCVCPYCRALLDFAIPPSEDVSFWGNWSNAHWREYLAVRRHSVGDFLAHIHQALPANFPLMSCCTSGAYGGNNYNAQSAHEFLRGDSILNLEICGDEPGDVYEHLASSSYHAGISKKYNVAVTAIGYGYFPDSAGHLWALNQMTGFSTWFSTAKANLGLSRQNLSLLPNDAEPATMAFAFESKHPGLFGEKPLFECAVFFSENTKTDSYFGACELGATADYRWLMYHLHQHGVTAETIFDFPENTADTLCVILPSVTVLTAAECQAMEKYRLAGGTIIAFGPKSTQGFPDAPADDFSAMKWLCNQSFDYNAEDHWYKEKERFFWNGARHPHDVADFIRGHGKSLMHIDAEGYAVSIRPNTIHLLALDYDIHLHPLEEKRNHFSNMKLIERVIPQNCAKEIHLERKATAVYCPLGGQATITQDGILLDDHPMYVIIQLQ